jgi:pimeloyl-ACP methyl ester carboxylesterase
MKRICKYLVLGIAGAAAILLVAVAGLTMRAAWQAARASDAELAALRPPAGRLVPAADAQIFVQTAGKAGAPAVVFVSGTGGWSGIWLPFMRQVADAGFHAVALDLPPFGYSVPPVSGGYDKASQARRILAALDSLQVMQATFVAHSIGSGPVMEAVLTHPERASRLILVNPALGLDAPALSGDESLPLRLVRKRWFAEALTASVGTNPLFTPAMVRSFVVEKDKITPPWIELYRAPLQVPGAYRHIARWLPELLGARGSLRSDSKDAYRSIAIPATLIWGRDDFITPLAQGQNLHALIPASRLVVLEGGHVPMVEEPQAFAAGLLEALAPAAPR